MIHASRSATVGEFFMRCRPLLTDRGSGPSGRSGAVAMMMCLLAVPMFLAVGGAIDYSRAIHFRSELQGAVDAAAIAGVSAYVSATSSGTATTVANNFMGNSIALLQPNGGVNATPTPSTLTSGGTLKGYLMTVAATGTMPTTFLGLLQPSISVAVTATAENPIVNISPTAAGQASAFSASAVDLNSVSWYVVPTDGSVPPATALTPLWSSQGVTSPAATSFQVPASAHIGFAMTNVTASFYTNQYGSVGGTSHTFYSHLNPPTNSTLGYNSLNNPRNVNGVNGSTGNNCALQVMTVPASGVMPTPAAGSCSPYTQPVANSQPSCSQLGPNTKLAYFWNDMGGYTDDKDYNDAQYTFSCAGTGTPVAGSATGPTTVVLIK